MVTARPESAHGPMEEYALTVLRDAGLPSSAEVFLRFLAREQDELHAENADLRSQIADLRSHAGLNVERPRSIPQMLERNGHSYIDLR